MTQFDLLWHTNVITKFLQLSWIVFHCLLWFRINQTFWWSASIPSLYIRSPGFRSHPTNSGCPYWSVCSFSPNSSYCCCIAGIELLQDIPLDTAITETTDHGKPIVIALPDSSQVKEINFNQADVVPLPAMRTCGGGEGSASCPGPLASQLWCCSHSQVHPSLHSQPHTPRFPSLLTP